jgi:hypothetical protein
VVFCSVNRASRTACASAAAASAYDNLVVTTASASAHIRRHTALLRSVISRGTSAEVSK